MKGFLPEPGKFIRTRRLLSFCFCAATMTTLIQNATAQNYDTNGAVVLTFVGSGFYGLVDGQGTQTMFYNPSSVVEDTQSNLFVLDESNYRIRKVTPDGTVSTVYNIGFGATYGAMAIDHASTLWFATPSALARIDTNGTRIDQTFNGIISSSSGVCVDSQNYVYFSAPTQNKIYRFKAGVINEVFVGSGNPGSRDGNGIFTSFNNPTALACDAADNIIVWDSGNRIIRRINQSRDVVTIAGKGTVSDLDGVGTNAAFHTVYAMSPDSVGNIYLAGRYSIRKMDVKTNVITIAGSFSQSGDVDGAGNLARINNPEGLSITTRGIFFSDTGNHKIRQISFNPQPEVVAAANLGIRTYPGISVTGVVGRAYQIQSSPGTTNWTTRETVLMNSSPYLWIDESPISGTKFYRAVLLP